MNNWIKNKDFTQIPVASFKRAFYIIVFIILVSLSFISFEFYVPVNPDSQETILFTVERGWGDEEISDKLVELGVIRSSNFFNFYVFLTLKHFGLQAGEYSISPKMSIHDIANKMAYGDVIKNKVVIPEGWDKDDIAGYMEIRGFCTKPEFSALVKEDYSEAFSFLKDKPYGLDLEGYLFPDTYELAKDGTCEDLIYLMLSNFDRKLTESLRIEIAKQKKGIFDIVVMASMIEKEVKTLEDKKIVSGILWKRNIIGMPLQIDATVVYITGRPSVTIKDTKIDSPYNTYFYYGLPEGPISNPGIDSIISAIYPEQSDYFYYLTDDGVTIFSETLEQHNHAKQLMK